MSSRDEMELPLYFGPRAELFGLFHATAAPAGKAVLLCPPLGQDQIRCHRLYRQLAQTLVAEGIAVLRFDYYGSGDSAGASSDVEWERCVADTVAAADELRRRSGVAQIIAFGARLGGSIALTAAAAARLAGLVVWDPVLDGSRYVAQLDAMQAALGMDTTRFHKPRLASEMGGQWLGFAVSERLRQQLMALRVELPGVPTLLLDSPAASAFAADGQSLPADSRLTVLALAQAMPWDDLQRMEQAILSHPLIRAVADHVREAA